MGFFTSGEKAHNDAINARTNKAFESLGTGNINRIFGDFQSSFSPMLAQMAQGAQVGANMDTQSLQAGLARQGLGGTGLGMALGGGLRSGANFQTNQLRAKLLADLFGQSVGMAKTQAGTHMQSAGMLQTEASGFQQTMNAGTQIAGMVGAVVSPFAALGDNQPQAAPKLAM